LRLSNRLGKEGEDKAVEFLKAQGLEILKRNFRTPYGEIDIIAQDGERLHFVEVKTSLFSDPLERIDSTKMRRILKSIDFYLYNHPFEGEISVDAIVVKKGGIEWIKNISLY